MEEHDLIFVLGNRRNAHRLECEADMAPLATGIVFVDQNSDRGTSRLAAPGCSIAQRPGETQAVRRGVASGSQ